MGGKCGCPVGSKVEAVGEDEERDVANTECERLDLGTVTHHTAPEGPAAGDGDWERGSPVLLLPFPQSGSPPRKGGCDRWV